MRYLADHSEWLQRCFAGVGDWSKVALNYGFGITDELVAAESIPQFQEELNRLPVPGQLQTRDGFLKLRKLLDRARMDQNLGVDFVSF